MANALIPRACALVVAFVLCVGNAGCSDSSKKDGALIEIDQKKQAEGLKKAEDVYKQMQKSKGQPGMPTGQPR